MDNYFEALNTIARENGIYHSVWSVDDCEDPLRDFSKPHGFTATMVDAGCRCGNKPTEPVQLIGDTWLDLWKSIERYIAQKQCGHIFIESMEQVADTLDVCCGS